MNGGGRARLKKGGGRAPSRLKRVEPGPARPESSSKPTPRPLRPAARPTSIPYLGETGEIVHHQRQEEAGHDEEDVAKGVLSPVIGRGDDRVVPHVVHNGGGGNEEDDLHKGVVPGGRGTEEVMASARPGAG